VVKVGVTVDEKLPLRVLVQIEGVEADGAEGVNATMFVAPAWVTEPLVALLAAAIQYNPGVMAWLVVIVLVPVVAIATVPASKTRVDGLSFESLA